MKFVFLSNYYNHHQAYLSECLYRELESEYVFVETGQMRDDRRALGYGCEMKPAFVLRAYENKNQGKRIYSLIDDADVVIIGSADEKWVANRIKDGKLVFRYYERPFKGSEPLLQTIIRALLLLLRNHRKESVFLLCASAFTASDMNKIGLFKGRSYKWGYFPETRKYDSIDGLLNKKKQNKVIWVGRLIDFKHVEDALAAVKRLGDEGYSIDLEIIGLGEREGDVRRLITKDSLEDHVKLLGAMKPQEVRNRMEEAGILLCTSDKREGWGVVINEAMNSGCAVVSSHVAGAAPYLIQDGVNGLLYRSGDVSMLCSCLRYLLDNPTEQRAFGRKAYETIIDEWNADIAAKRLVGLAAALLGGDSSRAGFITGPCSEAVIIGDDWF